MMCRSDWAPEVPEEMFREVKYYAVGDIDPQVIQLLKAGKAKEVSYNALASHIISEDGDNPEVGEAREPSWVTLSVQRGALLPPYLRSCVCVVWDFIHLTKEAL
ncbi:PAXIP1-like [Ictidomys tridecemlineatus]|uniref:PAX transactivation activation domain-interacting protein n=1 Tax=Ictidomys tridecemlineatus TaxID=43179 RepID=A0A287D5U1_ICTTR|nr:PAXIP1-like [Ictidomys tridecemlineatus]